MANKWRYFTRKELEENSPSRRDGISLKEENQLSEKCIRFMIESSNEFRIPQLTVATANVYYHRFFLLRSQAKHQWYRIAIACLFLASKVDENEFRLDDFGQEGWTKILKKVFQKEIPIEKLKKMIIDDEMEILIAINFELYVDLPYFYLRVESDFEDVPEELRRAAVRFISRTYFSSLCLQFEPQKIAGAAFHLCYKFLKLKLPFQEEEWYSEFFQMTLNELEDISSQMMDLYEYTQPPHSAPDNQRASSSSSSLPVDQIFSASPPLPAAHSNQSPPPPTSPSMQ